LILSPRNWPTAGLLRWVKHGQLILLLGVSPTILIAIWPLLIAPWGLEGRALGWDLAVYVAGARLIASGRGADLYDQWAEFAQRVALVGIEPGVSMPPGLPYIAPPLAALFYAPFAWIPFHVLEIAQRVLSLAGFSGAMYLMRRWLPVPWPFASLLGVATPWSLHGIAAGQSMHLLVLDWVVAARLVAARRLDSAACFLALGIIKPQIVLPGFGLTVLRGGWRGGVVSVGLIYAMSAAATGDVAWPRTWWHAATVGAIEFGASIDTSPGGVLLMGALSVGWLVAPSQWRGPLTLLLPVGALAASSYRWFYYDLLLVPAFWVLAWGAARLTKSSVRSIAAAIACHGRHCPTASARPAGSRQVHGPLVRDTE
jgi:hypothetical protein